MAGTPLTRQEMEQVIREGGSVLHNNRTLMRIDDLPTEAQLAGDDPARQSAAAAALQERISQLESELQVLQVNQTPLAEVVDPEAEQEPGTGKMTRRKANTAGPSASGDQGATPPAEGAADGAGAGSSKGAGDQVPPPDGQKPAAGAS